MQYLLVVLISLFAGGCTTFSGKILVQSSEKETPEWIRDRPRGYENEYFVGRATRIASRDDAREMAIATVKKEIAERQAGELDSAGSSVKRGVHNDQVWTDVSVQVNSSAKDVSLKGLEPFREYWEEYEFYRNGRLEKTLYDYYVLLRFPKPLSAKRSPPTSFGALWRSMLVPGWGQIYKDETAKGIAFFAAEGVAITAGVLLQKLSNTYERRSFQAQTQATRDLYYERALTYYRLGIGLTVLAAVIYFWNNLDALGTTSESQEYALEGCGSIDATLAFDGSSAWMSLRVRF